MPNPGSDKALDLGCTCPVLDNAHGKGYFCQSNLFVMSADCPLHSPKGREINANSNNQRLRTSNLKKA